MDLVHTNGISAISYIKSVFLGRHMPLAAAAGCLSFSSREVTHVLTFDKEFTCGMKIVDYFCIYWIIFAFTFTWLLHLCRFVYPFIILLRGLCIAWKI